jgi:uncharacterized protein YjbJ (UPF0337 family)
MAVAKLMRTKKTAAATSPNDRSGGAAGANTEALEPATGDTKSKVEGVMNQAAGTAQNLYGQGADFVRQNASPVEAWLRDKIETQPYTTVIAALGIGWLLGRTHRPL